MRVEPTGAVLGASIHGVDLTQPIDRATFGQILNTLGRYGVVRFPGQQIELGDLKRFSEMFGEIQGNPVSICSCSFCPLANAILAALRGLLSVSGSITTNSFPIPYDADTVVKTSPVAQSPLNTFQPAIDSAVSTP